MRAATPGGGTCHTAQPSPEGTWVTSEAPRWVSSPQGPPGSPGTIRRSWEQPWDTATWGGEMGGNWGGGHGGGNGGGNEVTWGGTMGGAMG